LDLQGSVSLESDVLASIVNTLPRPERLRVLKISLEKLGYKEYAAWWSLPFLETLSGLEELVVRSSREWWHTDHSDDPLGIVDSAMRTRWSDCYERASNDKKLEVSYRSWSELKLENLDDLIHNFRYSL
jgi:hypothetical protein